MLCFWKADLIFSLYRSSCGKYTIRDVVSEHIWDTSRLLEMLTLTMLETNFSLLHTTGEPFLEFLYYIVNKCVVHDCTHFCHICFDSNA